MRLALVADKLFPHAVTLFGLSIAAVIVGAVIYERRNQRVGDFVKDIRSVVLGVVLFCAYWFVLIQSSFWLYERFDSGVVGWIWGLAFFFGSIVVGGWAADRVRGRRASAAAERTPRDAAEPRR